VVLLVIGVALAVVAVGMFVAAARMAIDRRRAGPHA
jgi:hypothetical protein